MHIYSSMYIHIASTFSVPSRENLCSSCEIIQSFVVLVWSVHQLSVLLQIVPHPGAANTEYYHQQTVCDMCE